MMAFYKGYWHFRLFSQVDVNFNFNIIQINSNSKHFVYFVTSSLGVTIVSAILKQKGNFNIIWSTTFTLHVFDALS